MSLDPVEGPADLTARQRRYLRSLRRFRDAPPTMAGIFGLVWPQVAFLLLVAAAGVAVGVVLENPVVVVMVPAMVAGALIRDLAVYRSSIELWPATRAIVDYERVDELLGEPPDHSS